MTEDGIGPAGGSAGGCSVRVAVRVRPLIGQELTERCSECIAVNANDAKQVMLGKGTSFTFDYVFSKNAPQEQVYNECVGSLVSAAFDGYNATVLAYGQTGSGKTYTMGSASNIRVSEAEQGIIPRVIEDIFATMGNRRAQDPCCQYRICIQFLEIYGEEIKDLLDPVNSRVTIRENQDGDITVVGAREEAVESEEEMMLLLERGTLCRTTGSTLMNAQSSRSHAIFTILLENRTLRGGGGRSASATAAGGDDEASRADRPESDNDVITDGGGKGGQQQQQEQWEIRRSKFHFVDLAGSERAKRTGAEGKRLKEGIDINRGLLVLGNVISALGDSKKRGKVHVPYRDSKLTRMLQDSLGGNSQTLMIACVSPAETNMHETLNALRYANRARNIQNKPVVNRDRDSSTIVELKKQVQALAMELLRMKNGGGGGDEPLVSREMLESLAHSSSSPPSANTSRHQQAVARPSGPSAAAYAEVEQKLAQAEGEVMRLTDENKRLKSRASETSDELIQTCAEREYYRIRLHESEGVALDSSLSSSSSPPPSANTTAPSSLSEGGPILSTQQGEPNKVIFTDTLKGYLNEIISLKEKVHDLERSKSSLERHLLQSSNNASSAAMVMMASSSRGNGKRRRGLSANQAGSNGLHNTSGSWGGLMMAGDEILRMLEEETAALGGAVAKERAFSQEMRGQQHQQQHEDGQACVHDVMSEEEAGAFYRSHQEMSLSVADLSRDIELKEKLVKQLKESVKRYEVMKKFYEEKLRQMDEETARYEADRQKLLKEIEDLEKKTEGEQKELHQTLLKKLQEKEAQLQEAKKKQGELSQLARVKARTDAQMRTLGEEIGLMKKQRVDLLKRIDAEKKRFQAALKEKTLEIESMKRAARRDAQEIQKLGAAVEKADTARRRQVEEMNRTRAAQHAAAAYQRENAFNGPSSSTTTINHRNLRATTAGATTTRFRNRSHSGGGNEGGGNVTTKAWSSTAERLRYSEMERKTKKWLDAKIREVAKKEEAAERLAAEYQRRMALLKTKEDLETERNRIFNRHSPAPPAATAPIITSSPTTTTTTVREVIMKSSSTVLDETSSSASGGDHRPSHHHQQQQQHQPLSSAAPHPASHSQAQQQQPLTAEEEATLEELEERIETLQTQLEYKEDRIRKMETIITSRVSKETDERPSRTAGRGEEGEGEGGERKEGGEGGGRKRGVAVTSQIAESCYTLEQSHTVIRVLFDMLVTARRQAKSHGEKVRELEQDRDHMTQILEENQGRFKAEKRLFDQQLTRVAMEYEEKISGLIDHTQLSGLLQGAGSLETEEEGASSVSNQGTTLDGLHTTATFVTDEQDEGDHPHQQRRSVKAFTPILPSPSSAAALMSRTKLMASTVSYVPSIGGGPGGGEASTSIEQYKCMLRLSSERNQALRGQVHQAQAAKEELEGRIADLEARERKAREDFRESEGQVKWLEFELTKVRAEYIRLRGTGLLGKAKGAGQQQQQQQAQQQPARPLAKEDLKKLEKEVLGVAEEWDEEEDEEEEVDEDWEETDDEEEYGGGSGGHASRKRGDRRRNADSVDDEEDESSSAVPPWAKEISDDVDKHIKDGKAPPILMARGGLGESVRKAIILPSTSGEVPESPDEMNGGKNGGSPLMLRRGSQEDKARGMSADTSAYNSIFDRLADPHYFTGIHKHVNDEEIKEKRQRVENMRIRGYGPAVTGNLKPRTIVTRVTSSVCAGGGGGGGGKTGGAAGGGGGGGIMGGGHRPIFSPGGDEVDGSASGSGLFLRGGELEEGGAMEDGVVVPPPPPSHLDLTISPPSTNGSLRKTSVLTVPSKDVSSPPVDVYTRLSSPRSNQQQQQQQTSSSTTSSLPQPPPFRGPSRTPSSSAIGNSNSNGATLSSNTGSMKPRGGALAYRTGGGGGGGPHASLSVAGTGIGQRRGSVDDDMYEQQHPSHHPHHQEEDQDAGASQAMEMPPSSSSSDEPGTAFSLSSVRGGGLTVVNDPPLPETSYPDQEGTNSPSKVVSKVEEEGRRLYLDSPSTPPPLSDSDGASQSHLHQQQQHQHEGEDAFLSGSPPLPLPSTSSIKSGGSKSLFTRFKSSLTGNVKEK